MHLDPHLLLLLHVFLHFLFLIFVLDPKELFFLEKFCVYLSNKARFQTPDNLPFPKKEKLSKNETGNISGIIQNIILLNDFELNSILTDVGGLMDGSGILKMSVDVTGDFENLRKLILQLGTLPYLEHIENIHIDNANDKQNILLKLWIAQEA